MRRFEPSATAKAATLRRGASCWSRGETVARTPHSLNCHGHHAMSHDLPPRDRLDGKVAVITGGLGAIGAATAHRLAALGASIVLLHRKATTSADARCDAARRAATAPCRAASVTRQRVAGLLRPRTREGDATAARHADQLRRLHEAGAAGDLEALDRRADRRACSPSTGAAPSPPSAPSRRCCKRARRRPGRQHLVDRRPSPAWAATSPMPRPRPASTR